MRRRPWRTITRSLALMVAALLLSVVTPNAPASAQIPNNVDVSLRSGNEAEHAIAINPTNPSNIVTMSTLSESAAVGLFEGISFDGGATWTRQFIGTGVNDPLGTICCDEQLAWDSFGNLWLVYLFSGSNGNVPIAVSTDGGLTWTKVAEIVPVKVQGHCTDCGSKGNGAHNKGTASADQPSISAAAGSVWVSYTAYPSGTVQASGAPVTGLGQHGDFIRPETVPSSLGRGNFGDTAVGPDGQVMVVYQDQTSSQGGSRIYEAVDPDGLGPAGFGDPRFLARSRVGGFDYLPIQPDRSFDAEANLGWDRSGGPHHGRVYAVWTQEVKNESDDFDIMFQYSDDDGATWTPAIRLNDDAGTNSQGNPAIAVDQTNGDVAVSWYDARNDLGDGGPGDTDGIPNDDTQIWATYSTDGGITIAPNLQVSEGASNSSIEVTGSGFNLGDYTHAAFDSGIFHTAWSDNSNSTGNNPDGTLHQLDLYTAAVPIP
jgi:hypothetical protein